MGATPTRRRATKGSLVIHNQNLTIQEAICVGLESPQQQQQNLWKTKMDSSEDLPRVLSRGRQQNFPIQILRSAVRLRLHDQHILRAPSPHTEHARPPCTTNGRLAGAQGHGHANVPAVRNHGKADRGSSDGTRGKIAQDHTRAAPLSEALRLRSKRPRAQTT